jgi:RecA-family ATPase
VPEASLTILGGKKKVGKSWLARQIAGAVGTGDAIFNRPTMHGKVLFYCLEDGERRLQNRLKLQEATEEEDVEYFWELPPLNEDEGMEALGLAMRVMRPVLVIIDTLAAAKNAKIDENAAGPMADLINDLQRLARSEGVAILLVAHHGKSSFGDSGHDIRGSSAISAAADVNLGLYKRGEGYLLTAEGRDIEEGEYRMLFEEYRWQLVGDERSLSAQEAEDDVKRMMVILGETDAGAIARELSRHRSTVDVVLKRLLVDNRVTVRSHHEPGVGRPRMLYSLNSDWSAHDRYDLKK